MVAYFCILQGKKRRYGLAIKRLFDEAKNKNQLDPTISQAGNEQKRFNLFFKHYLMRHLCILCLFCYSGSFAQDPEFDTTKYSLWEIEGELIEIKAKPNQQIFSVSSLPVKLMQEHVEPQVQTLLNQMAGIWMESGALNTNRISIRGVGNREPFATSRIKVYLDEIPITDGFGETSMEDIDPSILSKIQVWKNPSSSIWGAGLGGMIHLQTQKSWDPSYSGSIQVGSFGRVRSVQQFKQNWDPKGNAPFIINYNLTKQDGYRDNNQYKKHNLMFMQRWRMSEKFSMQLFGLYIDLRSEIPSSLGWTDFNNNPEAAAANWGMTMGYEDYTKTIGGISFKYLISDELIWTQSYAINSFKSDELRPFNRLKEGRNNFTVRQRLSWQLDSKSHIQAGIEWFNEEYDWNTALDGNPQLLTDQSESHVLFNGFLQLQHQFNPRLYGFAGINLNTTTYDIRSQLNNDKLDYQYDPVFNPSIGLGYSLLDEKLHLIGSLSKGFNPINIEDALNSSGQLNPDLKPESGWSTDLGFRLTLVDFNASLTLYSLGIKNLIVQNRITEEIFESINAGKTSHQGLELEYTYRMHKNWQIRGAYSFLDHRFIDYINGANDYSGNALTGSPNVRFFHHLEFDNQKFSASMYHWYTGDTPIKDDGLISGDAYNLLNFEMRYKLKLSEKWSLAFTAVVNNLLDAHYASMYSINASSFGSAEPRYFYPGLPRHFLGDLKVSYYF